MFGIGKNEKSSGGAAPNLASSLRDEKAKSEIILGAIEDGVISATQFHPEKSGDAGLHLIKNWVSSL